MSESVPVARASVSRVTTWARGAYAALALADTGLAAVGAERPRWVTKPLLMPALMVGRDRPTQRALALCWTGDVALLGKSKVAFTAGLAGFLAGQVAWVAAFRGRPGGGALRRHPVLAVPTLVVYAGLNGYLWKRTGPDRLPVIAYSTALAAMALTAMDSGVAATALGGQLFLASDALIALDRFGGVRLPGQEGWVMATYTAAQGLLAQ